MLVIVTALAFTGMAQPAHVSVNTTVGFLLENIGRVYRKLENRLPSGVSGYTVIFPAHSPTLLKQAAKQMSEHNVDILVGYNSYVGLHQLHQIAGAARGHNSSRMLELSAPREMNWYLKLERSRLPRGCVDRHVMSAVVGCGSLQAAANALAAVITQLRWKHLSLLYHPDHELMSSLMLNSLSGAGVIVQHYSISNRSAVEAAINSSSAMLTDRDMNFMLFANQGFSKTVFQTLSGMQHGERTTLTLFSRWLIWGNDIDPAPLSNAINQISNVAVFQQIPCDRFKISSAPVEEMSTILLKRAIALAQRKTLDKACLTGSTPDTEAYKLFLAFQDLIACEECQSNPRFSVSSAMWKPSGRSFELVISGDSLSELNATEDRVFPNIAFGLNNITLSVATLPWSPFVMRHEEDGRNVYEGFSMDLLHEMALLLNFSYTVYEPADMEWGRIDDGRWTGLVGEMKRRKGDMAVAALSIQPEREEVMDFISAYFTDYTVILLKKPDENWAKWRTLIDPFQTFVIVAIIACLPVVSLVLTFCERVSPCYKNITNRHRYPGLHNYSDCFWYLLGALLTQGGIYLPKSQSSRTITGFWWLFSIIVVATYSGNLIASLTVVRDNVPINTVEELVEQSTYKWGTTNGTYINMMLQTTKDPIYRKLWAGIKEFEKDDPDVLNINHGLHIQRVKQGKYAYFNDLSSMLSETLKDCTLAYADEQFLPLHFAIGLQENSPYRAIFDEQMLAISESGLLNIWKRRWWPRNSTCVGLQIRQSKPISIFDVQSAYYLLLAGVTVAIISMVGETVRRVCAKKSPLQM